MRTTRVIGRRLILAAALPFLAVAATAQQMTPPGTAEPHSPAWGDDYKEVLDRTFQKILTTSGYDDPESLRRDGRAPTRLVYGDPEFTTLGTRGARDTFNPKDYAEVLYGDRLFEISHSVDELAFVLAHEITHLCLKHPEKKTAYIRNMYAHWLTTQPHRVLSFKDYWLRAHLLDPEPVPALLELMKAQEREADEEGLRLAQRAGYDPKAAVALTLHAEDVDWALGRELPQDHDSPAERAARLKKIERQISNAQSLGE